ncbi:MAG: SDR family NAD(P)-dependent oxidoreductase [Acidobacteriota bacterium]
MTDVSLLPLPPKSDALSGQAALVTGATSGLGWRFARVLANEGATVVVAGRREERLAEIVQVIEADGGTADAVRLDMTVTDLKSPSGGSEAFSTIASEPWPEALDPRLDPVLDRAFAEPGPTPRRNTRAVVVIHGGTLVAERYAEGFDAAMSLPGWSMTKSWTHAWIGRAVQLGHIDPDLRLDPSPWPAQDPRHAIDLDVLLRMSSGLAFEEDYGDLQSTALRMLFIERNMGVYAAAQPLEHDVDSRWYYSSGTTNLVSWHLREVLGAGAYWTFPHDTLFAPLGMASARVEPDAAGVYVGSSYGWATARDWARFGQLYLQDGVWAEERLLPEGWAAHAADATDGSRGIYGGHFWLNAPREVGDPSSRRWPELPADLYFASGYDGQYVVIVPSRDAVIVRLGLSQDRSAWDLEAFLADVLGVLPAEAVSSTGDRGVDPATDQSPSVTTIGE